MESVSPNHIAAPQDGGYVFRSTSMYSQAVSSPVARCNSGTGRAYAPADGVAAAGQTAVSYSGSFAVADRDVSQNVLAQTFAEENSDVEVYANGRPTTPPIGQPIGDMLLPLLACAAAYACWKFIGKLRGERH